MPQPPDPTTAPAWLALRSATPARIGLGRVGDAPPLAATLDFQLAHARARDAVHRPLDVAALVRDVAEALGRDAGTPRVVASAAADRATFLRRPDLGRRLDPAGRALLGAGTAASDDAGAGGRWDLAFVVADGLSPLAVQRHAAPVLRACAARLGGWRLAPVTVATQARVALGDEIGEGLGAGLVAVLIGERPGLSVADSLGIYLTFAPRVGRRDAERNCISNVHGNGMSYAEAADLLAWLAGEARRRGLSGVALKDERGEALAGPA